MSYGHMLYGAALSAVLAALALRFLFREVWTTTVVGAAAAFVFPLCWNLLLRHTGTTDAYSHDIPFKPFPISWQDVGSGVFTLAGGSQLLAWTTGSGVTGRTVARRALVVAVAALLIDIYTY